MSPLLVGDGDVVRGETDEPVDGRAGEDLERVDVEGGAYSRGGDDPRVTLEAL